MHRHILHNDRIAEAHEKTLAAGQVGLLAGWGVFSTIRVARGVPFAFERHFERMRRDAALMRVPFPGASGDMRSRLMALIEANEAREATLRVIVVRNRGGIWEGPGNVRDYDLIAFTTGLTKWGDSVRLALEPEARHAKSRFAGTKVLSWAANLTLYEEAHDRGYDEAVLLNERGEVSECTSANLFAAFGRDVFTPPLDSGCLPGVTRELLLGTVRAPGFTVRERKLTPADLSAADEVFITSTTRYVLPVREVEGLAINRRGEASGALRRAFEEYVEEYTGVRVAQSTL